MIDFAMDLFREEGPETPQSPARAAPEQRPGNGAMARAARRQEGAIETQQALPKAAADPPKSETDTGAPGPQAGKAQDRVPARKAEAREQQAPAPQNGAEATAQRARALAAALAGLARDPARAPLAPLFALWQEAPAREMEGALRALVGLVLRAQAAERAAIHGALAPLLRRYRGAGLARALALRLGGVFAPPPEPPPAPPPPPDPPPPAPDPSP